MHSIFYNLLCHCTLFVHLRCCLSQEQIKEVSNKLFFVDVNNALHGFVLSLKITYFVSAQQTNGRPSRQDNSDGLQPEGGHGALAEDEEARHEEAVDGLV